MTNCYIKHHKNFGILANLNRNFGFGRTLIINADLIIFNKICRGQSRLFINIHTLCQYMRIPMFCMIWKVVSLIEIRDYRQTPHNVVNWLSNFRMLCEATLCEVKFNVYLFSKSWQIFAFLITKWSLDFTIVCMPKQRNKHRN